MIGKQWRLPTMGLPILALAALACICSGLPGVGGILPEQPGAEGDTGVLPPGGGEAPAVGDDDVPLTYSGIEPGSLSSYRSQFSMTFVGTDDTGAPVDVQYTVSQAYSSDPPASSMVLDAQGAGVPEATGSMQMIQVGEVSYIVSEGECLSFASDETTPDQTFSPDDFLTGSDFSGARRVLPNENVNGVMTRHYQFSENEVNLTASGLTTYQGEVWVAVDGGYVVKQTISADGTSLAFSGAQGHLEWTYDLLDVNVPVSVEVPAGCEAPGGDIPVMADAAEVTSMSGFVSYSTASPAADVVAFYQTEMPAQGWTPGAASTDVPGFATLEFTREGQSASILITQGEGKTDVVAAIE